MNYQYDLFVIGAGSGGVRAARMSAGFGAKVAIAEDLYLGGTCVNVGCVPKKLFVFASHYAEDFKDAGGFGWEMESHRFNWPTLLKNKNNEIKRLNDVYRDLLEKAGVTLFNGRAVLTDAHTVTIDEATYTAERILIATGGWPSVPDIPGRDLVITSNDAFHLDKLPDKIVIVGGGYISVEFAGIFNGLGVDTTLVYRGELFLRGFDVETRRILADEMQKKGVRLLFETNITGVTRRGAGYIARTTSAADLETDLVMYATGRRPNIRNIGIEKLGVKLNEYGGIVVDGEYRSSVPSIFAIGDVTHRYNLTPVATAEGTALARNIYGNQAIQVDYTNIPTCIFSQPNLGTVGLTEEQSREKLGNLEIYKSSFTPLKHTLTHNREKTFMKIIVDKQTDKVLGVHMIGPDAGEIIQGVAIALKAGATKAQFDATIGIHPTTAEELVTMREPASD